MSAPSGSESPGPGSTPGGGGARIAALSLLYAAQGVPYGLASEYLPVVLRQAHLTMGQINLLGWLQLPWQVKFLWSHAADGPVGRRHGRALLLALQLALAGSVGLFALRPFSSARVLWFVLTALCALVAATQDVFVDALAVRTLRQSELGLGNTAQVAGYRLGMLAGGGGLLVAVGTLGERGAILGCALLIAAVSVSAFWLRGDTGEIGDSRGGGAGEHRAATHQAAVATARDERRRVLAMLVHLASPAVRPVLGLALTFKLGLHMASGLIKPMAVDAHWTREQIGWAAVNVGVVMAVLGATCGGLLHRALAERRALAVAAVLQALSCLPLLAVERMGAPIGWTTAAIAAEHFVTGLGTTVLFAALMRATRPADAGLQYTLLTSANVLGIGVGASIGGFLADAFGRGPVFVLAALTCLAPLALLPRWTAAARASAG